MWITIEHEMAGGPLVSTLQIDDTVVDRMIDPIEMLVADFRTMLKKHFEAKEKGRPE